MDTYPALKSPKTQIRNERSSTHTIKKVRGYKSLTRNLLTYLEYRKSVINFSVMALFLQIGKKPISVKGSLLTRFQVFSSSQGHDVIIAMAAGPVLTMGTKYQKLSKLSESSQRPYLTQASKVVLIVILNAIS